MKVGRVGKEELNTFAGLLELALQSKPETTCAIIIAPYLVSEKVTNGLRGEIRRVEDKMDAKQITTVSFSIRCAAPPSNKKVPLVFPAWFAFSDNGQEQNVFRQCPLETDRTPKFVKQVMVNELLQDNGL